jgi:glycolate oxidase iron-sulfur subunit
MQTQITEQFLNTPQGQEANDILRTCVHCGFCTATCPTYQLLGDELDGPRGRIYLIKQVLEGQSVSEKTQSHLDRCLTCRSCETTCPSGVQYGHLIDIGRELVEQSVKRDTVSSIQRYALRKLLPYPGRFAALLAVARIARPLLPEHLKSHIPEKKTLPNVSAANKTDTTRQMLVLDGCVQSQATPETNHAARNLLNKLGIKLMSVPKAGCCGAVSHHLAATEEALNFVRNNIDAWWPYIDCENPVEAIVITASGCGVQVKDYGHLLRLDNNYAEKARKVSELAKDFSEIITQESIPEQRIIRQTQTISFHSPCTLQHGQKLDGVVEAILTKVGFELVPVRDAHLCCGSAGTYSILQSELSQQLLHNKLEQLTRYSPELIATANIGCQMHLQSQSDIPVKHWIEILDTCLK